MSDKNAAVLDGITLEISPDPKLGYVQLRATESASSILPNEPTLIAIERTGDTSAFDPICRLKTVVDDLAHSAAASYVIEVHSAQEFEVAIGRIWGRVHEAEFMPVLVYMPLVQLKERDQLLDRALVRMRRILERFDRRPAEDVIEVTKFDLTSNETALDRARKRRAQLLANRKLWFNAGEVHKQQKPNAPSAGHQIFEGSNKNTASRLRRSGALLGVWGDREYLYPRAQFDPKTGLLLSEMEELLTILPDDPSGWRQVLWLFQPHARLDGKTPADVLQRRPRDVIEAARSTHEPASSDW